MHKNNLYRWCCGFYAGNIVLFLAIGFRYLSMNEWALSPQLTLHAKLFLNTFTLFAYVGQLGLLALTPLLILLPIIFFFPKKNFIFLIAIIIALINAVLLIADSVTYQLYRFHLNGVMAEMILHGLSDEILGFSKKEYRLAILIIIGLLLIESLYALGLWKYIIRQKKQNNFFKWLLIFLVLLLYLSYIIIVINASTLMCRFFIDVTRLLPLYNNVFTLFLPIKNSRTTLDNLSENYVVQQKKVSHPLHYPLQSIQCVTTKKPLNWVIIAIDAWRFDMLQQQVMPNLFAFSKHASVFQNHFSGGNATGPGIFSLFYGLPASYWASMELQRQGPVVIDELLRQHYNIGLFASASLQLPHFDRTVFASIKNLPRSTQGATPDKKDEKITQAFQQFIAMRKTSQPFFSFLFYDGAHSYCAYDLRKTPFLPSIQNCNRFELTQSTDPVPYVNRYKNALFLVDVQIQQVLDTLKKKHLLENTVVMVTGDHGEEFNDSKQGFWGHSSHFNAYQVRTPLILYWPGQPGKIIMHQTSHYDIAPTMMRDLLGCKIPMVDFSIGKSLFNPIPPDYLIFNSYISFAIRAHHHITTIFPAGNWLIQKLNGQPDPEATLDRVTLRQVFQDMRKYYKPV